jgi:hypothetical protein
VAPSTDALKIANNAQVHIYIVSPAQTKTAAFFPPHSVNFSYATLTKRVFGSSLDKMPDDQKDAHSSGEYSGVVEVAKEGVVVTGTNIDAPDDVISSGKKTQIKRRENREARRARARQGCLEEMNGRPGVRK